MHVAATVKAVAESNVVREAWAKGMELSVHGWVYHVATAKLRDLNIGISGPDGPDGQAASTLGSQPSSVASSGVQNAPGSEDDLSPTNHGH